MDIIFKYIHPILQFFAQEEMIWWKVKMPSSGWLKKENNLFKDIEAFMTEEHLENCLLKGCNTGNRNGHSGFWKKEKWHF